jgi:FKBP-type peptidyl-prolyl cis-trans isomerase SlyD
MSTSDNKVVSFEYELKDANTGEVLDSNVGKEPLEFVSGKGQIIPGLEKKLTGMNEGEKAEVQVPASEGYGEVNPDAVQTLPKEQFAGIDLQVGMVLYGQGENGETVQVTVKSFDDNNVVVDFNHPLAGKDLIFNVSVLGVRDATESEAASGVVGGGEESCGCGTGCGCS